MFRKIVSIISISIFLASALPVSAQFELPSSSFFNTQPEPRPAPNLQPSTSAGLGIDRPGISNSEPSPPPREGILGRYVGESPKEKVTMTFVGKGRPTTVSVSLEGADLSGAKVIGGNAFINRNGTTIVFPGLGAGQKVVIKGVLIPRGDAKIAWAGAGKNGVLFKPIAKGGGGALAAPPPPCSESAVAFARKLFSGGPKSEVAKLHKAMGVITNLSHIKREKIAKLTQLILLLGPYYDQSNSTGPIELTKDLANHRFGTPAPASKVDSTGKFGDLRDAFRDLANEFKSTFGIGDTPAPASRSFQGISESLKATVLADLAAAAKAGVSSAVGAAIAGSFGFLNDEGIRAPEIDEAIKGDSSKEDIANSQGLPNLNRMLDRLLREIQGHIDDYNKTNSIPTGGGGGGKDPCAEAREAMKKEIEKQLRENYFDDMGDIKEGGAAGLK